MTRDGLDAWVRQATPHPDIAPERVEAVIDSVLARLPAPSRRDSAWARLAVRLGLDPDLSRAPIAAVGRLAVPMAAAAVLGLIVGRSLETAETTAGFARLLTASSIYIVDL